MSRRIGRIIGGASSGAVERRNVGLETWRGRDRRVAADVVLLVVEELDDKASRLRDTCTAFFAGKSAETLHPAFEGALKSELRDLLNAQLSLGQLLPISGGLIVTTPQEVALLDVRKAVDTP